MTSKETNFGRKSSTECCMCGDPGFSNHLFQCKLCHFRSQHRYCSNIYPKLESLETCNWCLSQKESENSPNSSNSSSQYSNMKIRKGLRGSNSALQLQLQKKQIKKLHKSSEAIISPVSTSTSPSYQPLLISTHKRIITNGALEERVRRTTSEDITNTSVVTPKQVIRIKMRRYKLLHEVSS